MHFIIKCIIAVYCIGIFVCASTDDFKPFDYLNDHSFEYEDLKDLSPKITVQSVYSQGIGFDDMHASSKSNAFHVIVTITGVDQSSAASIPLKGIPVSVKAKELMPCIVEEGSGDFNDCSFSLNAPRVFKTNSMGRFSFSVPISEIKSLEAEISPILLQTEYMDSEEWIVAHIDADLHYRISKIQSEDIMKLNPSLNSSMAYAVTHAISHLMSATQESVPNENIKTDDRKLMARGFHESKGLTYDPSKNYISTYLTRLSSKPNASKKTLFGRIISKRHLSSENKTFGEHEHWLLDGSQIRLYSRDKATWRERVSHSVETVWMAVLHVLKKVNIAIHELCQIVVGLFRWSEIKNTVSFLSLFFRKVGALSVNGLDIIRDKYRGMLTNITKETDKFFVSSMEKMGVADLNYESASKLKLDFEDTTKKNFSTAKIDSLDADANTMFLLDRVVNNIPDASMSFESQGIFNRLVNVLRNGAISLVNSVDPKMLRKAMPHRLTFVTKTSILKMGVSEILNFARSLTMVSEQFFGNVYGALMEFLPLYWDLSEFIMLAEIKIVPFLHKIWTRLFGAHSKFSILDMMCLLGGTYASWQYQIYNHGVGPFTSLDIEVLDSAPHPELLLYTWNHDPRTSSKGNQELQNHRLGVYDWIPKCHITFVWGLMNAIYDIPMIKGKRDESNLGEAGEATFIPQVINSVMEMIGPIANYPFTQLDTNDPVALEDSIMNPDIRYFGNWYSWVIELFIRAIRPFLSIGMPSTISKSGEIVNGKSIWMKDPLYPMVNLAMVCGPLTLFGVKIQMDMAKTVSKDDAPRRAIVLLGWFDVVLSYVQNFLPFIPDTIVAGGAAGKMWMSVTRDILLTTAQVIRNNILIGFKVVGMLSSSFQPKLTDVK